MSSKSTQPLNEAAKSLDAEREWESVEDTVDPSETNDVPMAIRLDFAVLLTANELASLRAPESPFGTLPDLPPILYAVWRTRTDLHKLFDLNTLAGFAGLWSWAIRDGRQEIDALRPSLSEASERLTASVSQPVSKGLTISFPWISAIIWCARTDLQETYPTEPDSMVGFLSWFLKQGVHEMRCGDLLPLDHVSVMSSVGEGTAPPPFTRYLEFIHDARPDLASAFDIGSFEGRKAFVKWFFDHGTSEYPTDPRILKHQTDIILKWGKTVRQGRARSHDSSQEISNSSPA